MRLAIHGRVADCTVRFRYRTWNTVDAEVAMKTHVTFRSDAFAPFPDEQNEVNPGRYAERLAQFLAEGLKGKGFEALEPIAEDWGWVVPIKNEAFRLWIGCGNYEESPGGFLCFIEPHTPTVRRFFVWRVDTSAKVSALEHALDQLLAATAGISDTRWWTFDEFNR